MFAKCLSNYIYHTFILHKHYPNICKDESAVIVCYPCAKMRATFIQYLNLYLWSLSVLVIISGSEGAKTYL